MQGFLAGSVVGDTPMLVLTCALMCPVAAYFLVAGATGLRKARGDGGADELAEARGQLAWSVVLAVATAGAVAALAGFVMVTALLVGPAALLAVVTELVTRRIRRTPTAGDCRLHADGGLADG